MVAGVRAGAAARGTRALEVITLEPAGSGSGTTAVANSKNSIHKFQNLSAIPRWAALARCAMERPLDVEDLVAGLALHTVCPTCYRLVCCGSLVCAQFCVLVRCQCGEAAALQHLQQCVPLPRRRTPARQRADHPYFRM